MVTYCSNLGRGVFSTTTGHGVPKGKVRLNATGAQRDGEIMTYYEAQAIGIAEGFLIEFRSTDSFYHLCRSFVRTNPEAFEDLCRREEMDPNEVRRTISATNQGE